MEPRNKIIARIMGGLGNQLFCYAAARRLALATGAELVLDDVSGFIYDHRYKRSYQLDNFNIQCRKATPYERLEPFSRIRRYLKRKVNSLRSFEFRRYIQQEGAGFDSRLLNIRPTGTLHLEGYWQSAGYFSDVEETVRTDLRIKPPTDPLNLAVAAQIQSCLAVAVHVRFFNENDGKGSNAPSSYYEHAIGRMEALCPDAHYFVFSDRPDAARTRVPLPGTRLTLVRHNQRDQHAVADLWLMTQCKHFIISNSTFSWWAAWLAEAPDKHVIAPGFKRNGGEGSWNFRGLLPDEWEAI